MAYVRYNTPTWNVGVNKTQKTVPHSYTSSPNMEDTKENVPVPTACVAGFDNVSNSISI